MALRLPVSEHHASRWQLKQGAQSDNSIICRQELLWFQSSRSGELHQRHPTRILRTLENSSHTCSLVFGKAVGPNVKNLPSRARIPQRGFCTVPWACTAPSSNTYYYKKQKARLLFLWVALSVLQEEGLKGSGLQARISFRSTLL